MDNQKLVEMAHDTFIFLEKEFSFKLDSIERKGNFLTTLRYRSKKVDLGIDIEVESMDFGVYVLLVRLKDEKEPEGYYVNSIGEIVREHLYKYLLKENKLPNQYLSESRNKYKDYQKAKSEDKKIKIAQDILDSNATLLKEYIDFIKKSH